MGRDFRRGADLWRQYVEVVKPAHVTRLGLRYINHLRFHQPILDLQEYLVGLSDLPAAWPQVVSNFLTRLTLFDDERGFSAHVTRALVEETNPDMVGVLFDIDVFQTIQLPPSRDEVWGTLELLRNLKNRIFFNGITERTVEMYR